MGGFVTLFFYYQKSYLKSMAASPTMILIQDLLHCRYVNTQKLGLIKPIL